MGAVMVEVHAAEGGEDARLLVREQVGIYARLCAKCGLVMELVDDLAGTMTCRVTGDGAAEVFKDEPGGHRWQRVPPTEKKGRVQTSTITISVLPEPTEAEVKLNFRELEITCCRGSGPGGQARNMTASAVQVKHKPTGLIVRCDGERSQATNKQTALALLRARLWATRQESLVSARDADRRGQVGTGMRGDKRRTIRVRDDHVVDHVTGKTWRFSRYSRGAWD